MLGAMLERFRPLTRRLSHQSAELGLEPWLVGAVAVGLVLGLRPLPQDLDRGSLLAMAGLIVGILAITFGIVAVLRQHVVETYARPVYAVVLTRNAWQTAVVGEGVSIIVLVAVALWRPDMSAGAVGAVLILASLVQSWRALSQLLRQFDPLNLVRLQRDVAISRLHGTTDRVGAVTGPSNAILNLILVAAQRSDADLVAAGLRAWEEILTAYCRSRPLSFSDDYLYWLIARSEELVERYMQESVGFMLPVIVDGIGRLGAAIARYRNPLNADVDEGTPMFGRLLLEVVQRSGTVRRPVAAHDAVQGLISMAQRCIESAKQAVAQVPIQNLRDAAMWAGQTAPAIASQATIGLTRVLVAVADSNPFDVMRPSNADDIVTAIRDIARAVRREPSPAHFLTAPMSEQTLPRLAQTLWLAAEREGDEREAITWVAMAAVLDELCLEIATQDTFDRMVRANAVESCGCVVLGSFAVQRRELVAEVPRVIVPTLLELALRDDGRLRAVEALAPCLLATYIASGPPADGHYRSLVGDVLTRVATEEQRIRQRLAPVMRQLGATALHFDDSAMAELAARASVPARRGLSRQVRVLGDEFHVGGPLSSYGRLGRPGVRLPQIPEHYRDEDVQIRYEQLESRVHGRSGGAAAGD